MRRALVKQLAALSTYVERHFRLYVSADLLRAAVRGLSPTEDELRSACNLPASGPVSAPASALTLVIAIALCCIPPSSSNSPENSDLLSDSSSCRSALQKTVMVIAAPRRASRIPPRHRCRRCCDPPIIRSRPLIGCPRTVGSIFGAGCCCHTKYRGCSRYYHCSRGLCHIAEQHQHRR